MRNKINILFLFLFSAFLFSCEEEMEEFTGPYRLNIIGPHEVAPGTTEEFTIGDFVNESAYTWSVTGPAQIVGDATGNTVSVEFTGVGEAVISVAGDQGTGTISVEAVGVEPAVSATLNEPGVLRSGAADTIFFHFDAPLASDPDLSMNPEAFMSGTLGDLVKVDDQTYYAIYTAGEGDGTPQAFLQNIETTEMFGGMAIDSAFVDLYRVDNLAPVADLTYSEEIVNDSTVVTVTVTFNEPVTSVDPEDSTLYVTFSGAGVEDQRDALMATDNPLIWTYDYVVNGEGNGNLEVGLENIADEAKNEISVVNNSSVVVIDNVKPVVLGNATAVGSSVSVRIVSTEAGTGMYLILMEGETAPTTADEFMAAEGFASGSMTLRAGQPKSAVQVLAAGDYDVYFMARDEAGNFSSIESDSITVD